MSITRAPKFLALGLLVVSVLAVRPAECAKLGDWAKLHREAVSASGANVANMWGSAASDNLKLSDYYVTLSSLTARVQIEVARRRWFGVKRDSAAVMGAVHGFIVTGQNDSAAFWAVRDPALHVFRQFASARAGKHAFSFADALTNGSVSASTDCLLLALRSGAERQATDALLQRIRSSAKAPSPVLEFLVALVSRDTSAVVTSLEEIEKRLANPSGLEGSVLDRFGDPLIYWAMGQAHALLVVSASSRALATPDSSVASQVHLFRGRALYALREYDLAEAELQAATDPLDAGPSCAYMAGIACNRGDQKAARGWAQKCLSGAMSEQHGSSLAALGRIQFSLGAVDWPTAKTAQAVIKKYRGVARKTHEPNWILGLLAERSSLDASKEMFLKAGDGKYPYPDEGFSEAFCIDYLDMSVRRGLDQSFAPDLQFGYGGLDKFSEIVPATRSAVEGLRWLWLDIYDKEDGKQK
jgi:hypothetical protein